MHRLHEIMLKHTKQTHSKIVLFTAHRNILGRTGVKGLYANLILYNEF